jgi:hypothetical protein
LAVFLFPEQERFAEMAIYLVEMESADGQKRLSLCGSGKTRRACIQDAVDEASARDGIVYRAIATTSLTKYVAILTEFAEGRLPPYPSPRRIYVSPKAKQQMQLNEPQQQIASETGRFDAVLEFIRKERDRCIKQGDAAGARGFDQADAELRAAILDAEGGI